MPAIYRHHFNDNQRIQPNVQKFCIRIFEVLLASRLNFQTKKTYDGQNDVGCTITLNCTTPKCPHKYRAHFDRLGDANIFEFYKCLPLCHNGQSEISYCVKGHDNLENKQAYKPENKQAKLTQKLVIGLKGDSLMVIQVSLLPGQEKASFQTAEYAQAFFSEENFKDTRIMDQKEVLGGVIYYD
jgi:hypothetical protein